MIERNLWSRFDKVAGTAERLLIGECVETDFGYATIQLPGGSRILVQGAGTLGQRYFVNNGKLGSQAPELALLEIEI